MTFRARGAWNCLTAFPTSSCTSTSLDATEIDVEGFRAIDSQAPGMAPAGWINLNGLSWKVVLWARDSSGTIKNKVNAVVICPAPAGSCGPASNNTPIMIQATKANLQTPQNFLNSPVVLEEDGAKSAFRYYDPSVLTGQDDPAQEHIGEIDVMNVDGTGATYQFRCEHGACRISLG